MNDLVSAVEATPIPGPAWLFHFLLVFTFLLHALFMNLTLGGTILAAVGQFLSGGRADDHRAVLARRLMGVNTYGISFTITTAIAPLLFVQVLYQQYFYSATILIGGMWFALILMLMAGYYAAYLYKFKSVPSGGAGAKLWLTVAAVLFLAIAMVHVAVNLIHSQPEKWSDLAASPWSILGDPAYFVRLFHFVLAAIAFSGLVVAWWAVRQAAAGRDVELNSKIAGFAWKWALVTTFLQVADGFVLLFVLPRRVLIGLMTGGAATLVPFGLAVLLGLGLLIMLARVPNPTGKGGLVGGVLGAMTLTVAIMAITRHQVRELYLEPVASQFTIASAPQWGNFALFAVLLVAGLATVAWMVRAVFDHRAAGAEAA
jgi:hypothetical protein